MNRTLAMLCIGLIFGGGIGFAIAAANGVTLDGHDHGTALEHAGHSVTAMQGNGMKMAGHHGHDETVNLPDGAEGPTLEIDVTPDPASGWNLHIMTTNFRFSPEHASTGHVAGEGHAHIYLNGKKISRHYGPWYHIAALPGGENLVEVTLNANDHRLLAVGEKPLSATATVVVE